MTTCKTAKDVIETIKRANIQMVNLRFIDLLGSWQHFTVPAHQLDEGAFEEGFGFDGSSVRGWKSINASDMLMLPDPTSAQLDPFMEEPTMVLLGKCVDTITRTDYERCPRSLAKRAQAYLQSTGIADTLYVGPEAEFFVFDDVRYINEGHRSSFLVDSSLGHWNTDRDEYPNQGYKIRHKGGYVPVMPSDTHQDLRTEMVKVLEQVGMVVERQHMEVASGGQAEIDFRYDELLTQADNLCWFKYIIKNVAFRAGKTATFMPKPIFGDNGNGMHTHLSLWKGGKPLFAGEQYGGLSDMALHFIAGILDHAPALCALTNPSTNSYKRLVPGFEAPTNLAYSSRNRSASIRIPTYSSSPKSVRIEFRTPDATGNPYLAFSALMMAGLDGIERKLDPGEPLDKDIYSLTPEELSNVPSVPTSLDAALTELEKDHAFLLKGDVFSKDIIDAWVGWKREHEARAVDRRPHPMEFELYYDI